MSACCDYDWRYEKSGGMKNENIWSGGTCVLSILTQPASAHFIPMPLRPPTPRSSSLCQQVQGRCHRLRTKWGGVDSGSGIRWWVNIIRNYESWYTLDTIKRHLHLNFCQGHGCSKSKHLNVIEIISELRNSRRDIGCFAMFSQLKYWVLHGHIRNIQKLAVIIWLS